MTATRKPNDWLEQACEFGKAHESFVALSPRLNPKSWEAWRNYFRWLNWAPYWFVEVERKHNESRDATASWTAPCDHPDQFTVDFQPVHGPPPVFPMTIPTSVLALPAHERIAHIKRMRDQGRLTFHSPEVDLRKPWFQTLTPAAAQANLDRLEAEAIQHHQQTNHDEAAE